MPGPPPKDGPKLGRYKSPLDKPLVELEDKEFKVPLLPNYRERDIRVRKWWDTWLASPMAENFTGTDYQRLLMLAPMVEEYYRLMDKASQRGSVTNAMKLYTEIRQSEGLLGATHLDRLRGRIKIEKESEKEVGIDDDDETPIGVTVMAEWKKALGA